MKRWYGFAIVLAGLAASGAAQEKKEQDLPYKAVHDPQFIAAGSATFLQDPDRVIGVMAGTVAKAYPAAILSQHGLVEDARVTIRAHRDHLVKLLQHGPRV